MACFVIAMRTQTTAITVPRMLFQLDKMPPNQTELPENNAMARQSTPAQGHPDRD
jgi:hypothetical protein